MPFAAVRQRVNLVPCEGELFIAQRCNCSTAKALLIAGIMELDAASLAIGRIERALSRLERASQNPLSTAKPLQGDLLQSPASAPEPASPALEAEVRAVIAEMDRLIAEASHG